jgi:hypothetical protein
MWQHDGRGAHLFPGSPVTFGGGAPHGVGIAGGELKEHLAGLDGEAVVCGADGNAVFDALHRHGMVREGRRDAASSVTTRVQTGGSTTVGINRRVPSEPDQPDAQNSACATVPTSEQCACRGRACPVDSIPDRPRRSA